MKRNAIRYARSRSLKLSNMEDMFMAGVSALKINSNEYKQVSTTIQTASAGFAKSCVSRLIWEQPTSLKKPCLIRLELELHILKLQALALEMVPIEIDLSSINCLGKMQWLLQTPNKKGKRFQQECKLNYRYWW